MQTSPSLKGAHHDPPASPRRCRLIAPALRGHRHHRCERQEQLSERPRRPQRLADDARRQEPLAAARRLQEAPVRRSRSGGPCGATGAPAGPAGAQGPKGAPGISGWERTFTIAGPFDSSSPKTGEASCPPGKKLLGGGGRLHHLQAVPPPIAIQESYAADDDTWRVVGAEISPTAVNWEPVVTIICGTVVRSRRDVPRGEGPAPGPSPHWSYEAALA